MSAVLGTQRCWDVYCLCVCAELAAGGLGAKPRPFDKAQHFLHELGVSGPVFSWQAS